MTTEDERSTFCMLYAFILGISKGECVASDPLLEELLETCSNKAAHDVLRFIVGVVEGDFPEAEYLLPVYEQKQRLQASLDGRLVDRLCDACSLSPRSRRLKWDALQVEIQQVRDSHIYAERQRMGALSTLARVHSENERAYQSILKDDSRPMHLKLPLEEMSRKPPIFWHTIRLDKLDATYKRATIHRIRLIVAMYGKSSIPLQFQNRCDDYSLQMTSQPPWTVPKRHSVYNCLLWCSKSATRGRFITAE